MSFDRLAPHYDWMEALGSGRLLQRVRTALLDEFSGCERILSVGEGHGRFAAACARRFPHAALTCVEASDRMLRRAQSRLSRIGGARTSIEWVHASALEWAGPRARFDAIATCYFLDCFAPAQLAEVVRRLGQATTSDARWLVVDFAVPSHGLARWRALGIHALLYLFFRATTGLSARRLTLPDPYLREQGFVRQRFREFDWGLLRAEVWQRGVSASRERVLEVRAGSRCLAQTS